MKEGDILIQQSLFTKGEDTANVQNNYTLQHKYTREHILKKIVAF